MTLPGPPPNPLAPLVALHALLRSTSIELSKSAGTLEVPVGMGTTFALGFAAGTLDTAVALLGREIAAVKLDQQLQPPQ